MNEKLAEDFATFAKAQIASGDLDPMYPVLAALYKARGWDRETSLWHTLLYLTWYHVGSAEHVFWACPKPGPLDEVKAALVVPTGVERRGFRGNGGGHKGRDFVAAALRRAHLQGGSLAAWVDFYASYKGAVGWRAVRGMIEELPGGGSWSGYKWADLMAHVHGYSITADDIGVGGGSPTAGPVPGMVRLTGLPWERCARDSMLQQAMLEEFQARGVPFTGLDQMETALCDFNSLCAGRYYVGHDIDDMMDKLRVVSDGTARTSWVRDYWKARGSVFPETYLGEVNARWRGVRKELKRVYADEGRLVNV